MDSGELHPDGALARFARERGLTPDQFDVQASCDGQIPQIAPIEGVELVAVVGEEHDSRVDDIGLRSGAQQHASPATQIVIEGLNVDARQEARHRCLAPYPPRHTWPITPP